MKTMTIEEFCSTHHACAEGRIWATDNCKTMQQAWETARPKWTVWIATRVGVLMARELRLFAVWVARQVQHLLDDPRSIKALEVVERFANGEATIEELKAARAAAWAARRAAAASARAAAWAAAWAARRYVEAAELPAEVAAEAAWAATGLDAESACKASELAAEAAALHARAVELTARRGAAEVVAQTAHAQWLRENTTPNFNHPCQ